MRSEIQILNKRQAELACRHVGEIPNRSRDYNWEAKLARLLKDKHATAFQSYTLKHLTRAITEFFCE
jgi:hypothetical protein